MTDQILFYKSVEPWGFLNNFRKARFFVYGDWFDTVEHAYQIQKTTSAVEYNHFMRSAITPRQARDFGQLLTMREGWNDMRVEVMRTCVMAKFLQHHDLLEKLLNTGIAEIVEDSPIDWFWGWGSDHSGANHLGKILMEVREELGGFKKVTLNPDYEE